MDNNVKQLMISGSSPVKETAGSIVKCYIDSGEHNIELRAIGASAVNQMYKSMATARAIFAQKGLDLSFKPGYDEVIIDDEKKTVMVARLIVQ